MGNYHVSINYINKYILVIFVYKLPVKVQWILAQFVRNTNFKVSMPAQK